MKKTFDIIQKIIFILTDIIIIFMLIIWFFYIFQVHINKVPKEKVFSYIVFAVSTGSMADTINVNDIILVERTKDVRENDIIAFKQDNGLIVHRIIEVAENEITTKGDANNHEDESIKYEQVIGKVVRIIPLRLVILIITAIITFNIMISLIEKYIERNTNK